MNNRPAIRIARTQRMLAELGHADIFDALRHADEMRSALRVIHTWAGVPGALDTQHVRELAAKALHMDGNALAQADAACGVSPGAMGSAAGGEE